MAYDQTPRSVASDLALHCWPMSHKRALDRLILAKRVHTLTYSLDEDKKTKISPIHVLLNVYLSLNVFSLSEETVEQKDFKTSFFANPLDSSTIMIYEGPKFPPVASSFCGP